MAGTPPTPRRRVRRLRRRRAWTAFWAALLTVMAGFVVVAEARIAGDAIEQRTLAAFYEQPADATDGAPGTLVRSEELVGVPFDARAWRVMYRTTDVHGTPVLSTGIVVTPAGPAPAGGRTVVSWGHPTTGAAADCAPSRAFDPYELIEGMRLLLDRGYTIAATDYVGMGTDGPDSYLVGDTGGNAVLDAVRAAQHLPAAHASNDVVLWGHSQGGQAVLFAAQRAPQYAPELTVRGVAVAAPAADLTALLSDHIDDISGVTIGSYAFASYSTVYADRGATLESILTPTALKILPKMNGLCLLPDIDRLHRIGDPAVGHSGRPIRRASSRGRASSPRTRRGRMPSPRPCSSPRASPTSSSCPRRRSSSSRTSAGSGSMSSSTRSARRTTGPSPIWPCPRSWRGWTRTVSDEIGRRPVQLSERTRIFAPAPPRSFSMAPTTPSRGTSSTQPVVS